MPAVLILSVIDPTEDVFGGEGHADEALHPPEGGMRLLGHAGSRGNLDEVGDGPRQDKELQPRVGFVKGSGDLGHW